jgi:glycosyltransferase involved in cell wall biosynthesis
MVVMPLEEVDFQAGITTILEAMSMGKCVLCSRTRGQTDTIVDDQNGRYVATGDADALRSEILELLNNPGPTERLGANARDWAVENADVERYAERLSTIVDSLRPPPASS